MSNIPTMQKDSNNWKQTPTF